MTPARDLLASSTTSRAGDASLTGSGPTLFDLVGEVRRHAFRDDEGPPLVLVGGEDEDAPRMRDGACEFAFLF